MIVFGKTLVQVGIQIENDPSRGPSTTFYYEGTRDAVNSEAAKLVGIPFTVDHTNPPISKLQFTITGSGPNTDPNAILETQFELLANQEQRSGYEHKKSLALDDEDANVINTIKTAIKNNRTPTTALGGDAVHLYRHMKRGQDAFFHSAFVFRITQIIDRRAVIDIAYSNINRVYTNAALVAETNPWPLYQAAITSARNYVYNTYYGSNPPAGFTVGWLKQAPTITTVAGGKSAVSVEYYLEAWSDFYYGDT